MLTQSRWSGSVEITRTYSFNLRSQIEEQRKTEKKVIDQQTILKMMIRAMMRRSILKNSSHGENILLMFCKTWIHMALNACLSVFSENAALLKLR